MTDFERLTSTEEGRREMCVELSHINVTEQICKLLNESGMSRKEFARRLKRSPSRVSQMLDGSRNLTLKNVAKMLAVFDHVLDGASRPLDDATDYSDRDDAGWSQQRVQRWCSDAESRAVRHEPGYSQVAIILGEFSRNSVKQIRLDELHGPQRMVELVGETIE